MNRHAWALAPDGAHVAIMRQGADQAAQVLPLIGRIVSGHRTAYTYLPRSVANFPVEEELAKRMERAGFARVTWSPLSFGVAAIHVGESPIPRRNESR